MDCECVIRINVHFCVIVQSFNVDLWLCLLDIYFLYAKSMKKFTSGRVRAEASDKVYPAILRSRLDSHTNSRREINNRKCSAVNTLVINGPGFSQRLTNNKAAAMFLHTSHGQLSKDCWQHK